LAALTFCCRKQILPFVHERYNDVKEEIVKLESTLVTKLVQPSLSEKANGQKISGYNEKMASTLLQLQRVSQQRDQGWNFGV